MDPLPIQTRPSLGQLRRHAESCASTGGGDPTEPLRGRSRSRPCAPRTNLPRGNRGTNSSAAPAPGARQPRTRAGATADAGPALGWPGDTRPRQARRTSRPPRGSAEPTVCDRRPGVASRSQVRGASPDQPTWPGCSCLYRTVNEPCHRPDRQGMAFERPRFSLGTDRPLGRSYGSQLYQTEPYPVNTLTLSIPRIRSPAEPPATARRASTAGPERSSTEHPEATDLSRQSGMRTVGSGKCQKSTGSPASSRWSGSEPPSSTPSGPTLQIRPRVGS